ncbi:MAG TPA: hypothetical protein VHA73_02780 [Acidimicrobiales bacterium]|jgi:hypothetical protein|nr:hypothetical protein [Acidimicrobiales bacterium]
MTALVSVLTAAVVLLALLVAGLLRSHATILRRLHELDDGGAPVRTAVEPPIRTVAGVPEPVPGGVAGAAAPDISGRDPTGNAVVVRVAGVDHHTVLVFLTSGCQTCQAFWSALADRSQIHLPKNTRLVVLTKDLVDESPSALDALRPRGLDVVASSQAWTDYAVPGSPYVVSVDGPAGRINGEGTGLSWEQVARLLSQATGDVAFLSSTELRDAKPLGDAAREAQVDRELMQAGIMPGDPSLYPTGEPAAHPEGPR